MTEKRFAVTQTTLGSGIYDYQVENELCESYDEDAYREVCKKLNEFDKENNELKARCEEYMKLSIQYKQKYDEKISDNTFLEEENKELKEKNKLIFEQIMAFKKECVKDIDFEGSRTIYRLLSHLKDLKNGD